MDKKILEFKSGTGRMPTEYVFINTFLLPAFRVSKTDTQRHGILISQGRRNRDPSTVSIKQLLINEEKNIFPGMTPEQKQELKKKGLL